MRQAVILLIILISVGCQTSAAKDIPKLSVNHFDQTQLPQEEQIKKLLAQGNISEAVRLLNSENQQKQTTEKQGNEWGALVLQAAHREALKSFQSGNPNKAVRLMETAFEIAPLGIEMILKLNPERVDITFITSEKDYQEQKFDKFLSWDDYTRILFDYGAFLARTAPKYAPQVLNQIIEINPQDAGNHFNLAEILWKMGHQSEALGEYQEYVQILTSQGKAGEISPRVKERLNSKSSNK